VYCLYCVISLGVITLVTLLSLGWVVAERMGRKPAPSLA